MTNKILGIGARRSFFRRSVFLLLLLADFSIAWSQTTYTYYAINRNGSGYLRQRLGAVSNDGTFRYENAHDTNGSSIWILSSDGYLQQDMYYLNVVNGQTLVLSTEPVSTWDLVEDGTGTAMRKRLQLHGTTKMLGLSGSTPVVAESPQYKYAACEMTVTETAGSWTGPHLVSDNGTAVTVQSPQLVSSLRAYYKRKMTVTILQNDKGDKNQKVVDNKDTRVYSRPACGSAAPSDSWAITGDGILYNKITANVAVAATFSVTPYDPIAAAAHTPVDKEFTVTLQPLSMVPADDKKYLLFYTKNADYRFPYDQSDLSADTPLKPKATKSVLTDPVGSANQQISWQIEVDPVGFYSFKNGETGRYIYFDATDYSQGSDYGVVKVGATSLPADDNRYKFRLYKTNDGTYGVSYHIIPYHLQYVVHASGNNNNDGVVNDGIFCALNVESYKSLLNKDGVVSLQKANGDSYWRIYAYAAEDRMKSDYTIDGPAYAATTGDYNFTATTFFSRNIVGSPANNRELEIVGTYSNTSPLVNYTWTVSGLNAYISTTNNSGSGKGKLKVTVSSMPKSAVVGSVKVVTTATSPVTTKSVSNNKTVTFNLYPTTAEPTEFTEIAKLSDITSATGTYKLTADITSAADAPAVASFSGFLDGDGHHIQSLRSPLFTTLTDATVRNLTIDNVSISASGSVGAIACTTAGGTNIYNIGIMGGTVKSTDGYCGGLVGQLDGSSHVINCFSAANITGGTTVGGLVGYNSYASKQNDIKTMVMNCMFYGDITGGTSKAPIYNGQIISNKDGSGLGNYNYFRAEASYVQNQDIQVYNCALMAETRFLQRFEFFRQLLNSHRDVAAWYATGSSDNKDKMMKWVLEPSQLGTAMPYPVLKPFGKYPSVVNIDAEHAPTTSERNKGAKMGTLDVTIRMGDGEVYEHPADAAITTASLTLNITDKDPDHFNFNYYKVQLPYYNDVGTKNYTGNRVVTGWKIVSITGGTAGSYTTGDEATTDSEGNITATPYNFADRLCTQKDLYSVSKRVFNQGAYWDVPEGVTAITIEPYWAKAAYVADAYADVVYNTAMGTAYNVSAVGGGVRYVNKANYPIAGQDQLVYTSIGGARDVLDKSTARTVYDCAIVLVGNLHNIGVSSGDTDRFYTIMSADFDHDNEPDYSYILRYDSRCQTHPVRVDFLNIPGLGMAQKSTGGTGSYNFGIMQPIGWFEATNTSLFRVTQFEYDRSNRAAAPLILHGGVIEQWVSGQNAGVGNLTTYFHVGGNVWFKEFHRGTHQDNTYQSKHPPVSVTGGDYDEFYLTGLYIGNVDSYDDNAECYINGGRFGLVAGAAMEGIGDATKGTGNIVWQIQNADISEFYGGGINAAKPVLGNITTVITGGYIKQFCGGPKFGDMQTGKTVVTKATGCIFDNFFGAGYGGNSYSRYAPKNQQNKINIDWNTWVRGEYKQDYSSTYKGVSTQFNYQFLPMSGNADNVCRIFVEYVSFSLATTHNVNSTLTDCTVTGNFYGGGSLGKVSGNVTSTLNGHTTVRGSVYGAGFSATLPTVEVDSIGFRTEPLYYTDLGSYRTGVKGATTTYTWEHSNETVNSTARAIDTSKKILYTNEDLTALGTVTGNVTLNIEGTTTVNGDVYGGGALASSNTDYYKATNPDTSVKTTINLTGGTVKGDVYGGGMGRLAKAAVAAVGTEGTGGYRPAEAAITAVEALVGNTLVNLNKPETTTTGEGDDATTVTTYGNCVVEGSIFGCNNLNGTPKGNATVHVYKTSGAAKTAEDDLESIDHTKHKYHLEAVYGGGNLAAYVPDDATTKKAHVIIDGCDQASIRQVYGGGNAASVPATQVDVYGTYEIDELFGGGNGYGTITKNGVVMTNPGANVGFKDYWDYTNEKDLDAYDTKEERLASSTFLSDYVYGSGKASVNIYGGLVHSVFGGSNTRGNVRVTAVTMLQDMEGCQFSIDEAYGGGKSAPMDAEAQLLMSCIPGLKVAYGGAEAADVQGGVSLNITNGTFDRVFGGNNISGTINGPIVVNIQESGCRPIIIGQLYGGGNQAAYTGPLKSGSTTERQGPTLNVRSFTSIGEVYGGGYGNTAVVTGDTYVNIDVYKGKYFNNDTLKEEKKTITFSEYKRTADGGFETDDDDNRIIETQTVTVTLPSHAKGAIGAIGSVFGGGNAAEVRGNTHVSIGTATGTDFYEEVDSTGITVGTTSVSNYYTRSGAGTAASPYAYTKASGAAVANTAYYEKKTVLGADIRGNVYGGGNNADVTGRTDVVIGRQAATPAP